MDIEQDILVKASQGDLESFEKVYKTSASFVYNVAFRVVGNREDAQEVTQEVFMIVHNKLKSFRFESSFKTWVYRITANTAINFAKKTSSRKTVAYEEIPDAGAVQSDVDLKADRDHQSHVVDNLLGVLNPDQRACVVLRNMEGLSYQEIADTLKININTVRSRLKRAREHLLALGKKADYEL